jgi:hypothetical protein
MGIPATADGVTRPGELLADAARLVAAQGVAALPAVLDLVAAHLSCRELVLRAADGASVLARAASGPLAPSDERPVVLDLPVRLRGELRGLLTATRSRPFTETDARLLSGVADLSALVLAGDPATAVTAAGRAVLDEEAERAQVAATLYEGVGHALAAVRYAAELVAAGRADVAALEEPVRAALSAVRLAYRDLRAHALESGLRAALRDLAERHGGDRPDDGVPEMRLSVLAEDERLDLLPPPVAVTMQRVAEAALRGATGSGSIRASCEGQRVKLCVDSAEIAYDASELSRWARRANALGGDLLLRPDGVELSLPVELPTSASPTPREGHDDDGSDLRRSPAGP